MLSVENLPDPSCSYKISGLKGDERATEKLALQEADPVQPGLFSIRNYVFSSRSKDIGTNWPFPPKFLQLCLKHGVKEILPPFEPPDSVRAQSSVTPSESDRQVVRTEGEEKASTEVDNLDGDKDANGLLDVGVDDIEAKSSDPCVVENSEKEQTPFLQEDNQGDGKSGTVSKSSGLSEGGREEESTITVTAPVQAERDYSIVIERPCSSVPGINKKTQNPVVVSEKSRNSSEPQENKRRLIVKLGGVSEYSSRTEELVSNSSSVLDPMASKVCPVCKTFSSTSNTTLNAHIDQCLSEESTAKREVTQFDKPHKVKPRKKRSMVDICATAPRCTLEELERRNGLTRATDSSSAAPNEESTGTENKRPRRGPTDFCDEGNDSAVYVDSSGTKIRILSRFNDAPAPVVAEDRNILAGKKNPPGLRGSKTLKAKSQSKKFSSMKQYKGEVLKATEIHQAKNQEKGEPLSQLLKTRDPERAIGPPGTLRQWVCSKRTGLSKKSGEKASISRDPLHESNHPSIQRSHILRLSRRPENPLSSPKSKREETVLGSSTVVDNGEGMSQPSPESDVDMSSRGPTFPDSSIPKVARSPGNYVSSPRNKRVEVDANIEDHHSSASARRISSLRKSGFPGQSSPPIKENKWNEKRVASRNSCKVKRMDQSRPMTRQSLADELMGPRVKRLNKMHVINKLAHLEKINESVVEPPFSEASEGEKNVVSTPEGSSAFSGSEKLDSEAGGSLSFESDHSASSHKEVMVGEGASAIFSVETVREGAYCESEMSEDDGSANQSVMQSDSTHLNGNVLSAAASGSPMWVDHNPQRFYGRKEMGSHDYAAGTSSQIVELDPGVDEGSLSEAQNTGSDTDAMPMQGSELCLPSFEDMGYDVLHGNSSFGARTVQSAQDTERPRDPSPSPVSATSTDSPTGRRRSLSPSALQDKVSGSSSNGTAELVEAVDKIHSSTTSFSFNLAGAERNMKLDRENLKITIPTNNVLQKFSDDQPCCCSRKENVSRMYSEPQIFKQSTLPSRVVPKGKQVNLGIHNNRPEISNLAASPSSRIDTPTRESPFTSNKLHLDTSRKLPNCGDFGLVSPSSSQLHSQSTSNPVLRLMGKNLMVVNKDEDEPVQLQKSSLGTTADHSNSKYLTLLGFSGGNALNQDSSAVYHQSVDGSVVYGQDTRSLSSTIGGGLSSSFRGQNGSTELPMPPQEMWVGGFAGPALAYGSKGKYDSLVQQKRVVSRGFGSPSAFAYNVERSAPHQVTRSSREVIIIDDNPELDSDPIMRPGASGSRINQFGYGAIMSPSASNCNPRPAKTFSSYSTQSTFLREPPGPKPSFLMSCPGANATSTRLGNHESSGVFPQSPFLISSTGYLNSTVYYTSSPK